MDDAMKAEGTGAGRRRPAASVVLVATIAFAVFLLLRPLFDPHRRQVRAWLRAILEDKDGKAAMQLASDSAFDEENVRAFARMVKDVDSVLGTSPKLTASFPLIEGFYLAVVCVLQYNKTPEALDAVMDIVQGKTVADKYVRIPAFMSLVRYTWPGEKSELIEFYDREAGGDDEVLRFLSIRALGRMAEEDGCRDALARVRGHLRSSDDEVVIRQCLTVLATARLEDLLELAKVAFRSAKTWNLRSHCIDIFITEQASDMIPEVRAFVRDGIGALEIDKKALIVSQYADLMGVDSGWIKSEVELVERAVTELEALYQQRFGESE